MKRGFTLLELLLSVAVIGLLAGISIPVLSRVQTKTDLDTATAVFVSSLRRAEALAQSVDGDTSWGVHTASGVVVLFKGISYAGRDATYDEIFSVPTTITVSGLTDVVMNKFTGYPTATGTATFVSSVLPDTKTVSVNAKGAVSY